MYFCMYFGKIGVCMMSVFVSAAKVVRHIDTDTFCEIHTTHTKYIQKKSKIQHKYIQIHTNTYTKTLQPTFFSGLFSLYVFCLNLFCIVSILMNVIYRYMSHT